VYGSKVFKRVVSLLAFRPLVIVKATYYMIMLFLPDSFGVFLGWCQFFRRLQADI
jgi:hypothetical protein